MRDGIPMYQKMKRQLMEDIEAGRWPSGQMLPSEAELSELFHVSRTTVRQAIGDLVSMGYVTRQQGKGTFVADARASFTASSLYGFAEELRQRGESVNINILSIRRMVKEESPDTLPWSKEEPTLYLHRIADIQGVVHFQEISYLRLPDQADIGAWERGDETFEHVYGFFERNGVKIASGVQTLHADLAQPLHAERLQILPGAPILVVERTSQNDCGDPVEYSIVHYPGERYRYEVKLLRKSRLQPLAGEETSRGHEIQLERQGLSDSVTEG
ncbi:MAG: GntR family transcriptional regulator [Alicyclobacillaceae bacterium]|jgi:GntR family transcriptional regulator|uniref:GntR family transcriptional regulator n=1 Tax=Alicyclobacillus sp. SP_1 TaxID=2942475 RepID=UPI002158286D|nr:GntR family transcriptional regulator [Alicyclobacillus sp. SP_1]MCY0888861.1 GntR family transcriptional regulator [Alicyclobacillaceae bacterium]